MAHNHDGKNLLVAFLLNLSFSIIEIICGIYSNSYAIISDALHDFVDSLIILFAYFLKILSKKKSNLKYQFGFSRLNLVGALITSFILIVGSLFIIVNALPRLVNPEVVNTKIMMFLAIIAILINFISMLKMKSSHSLLDKAIVLHLLEDVLGWIAILVSSIIIYFTQFYIIDPILSIVISLFISYKSIINIIKCFKEVLLVNPLVENHCEIVSIIKTDLYKIINTSENEYIIIIDDVNFENSEVINKKLFELNIHKVYYKNKPI